MFKNLLQIYSLLICVCIVIILLIQSYLAVSTTVDLLSLPYKETIYTNNEEFIKSSNNDDNLKLLSQEELTNKRLEAKKDHIESRKITYKYDLIKYLGYLIINTLVLFIHYRIYTNSSKSNE